MPVGGPLEQSEGGAGDSRKERLAKAFREMHCLFQTENVLSTEYLVNLKSEYFLLILFDRETRPLGRN